jgi:hypothetical protein
LSNVFSNPQKKYRTNTRATIVPIIKQIIPSTRFQAHFPMCGIYHGPLVSRDDAGNPLPIQVPLKRLFAKVQVNISIDVNKGLGTLLESWFGDAAGLLDT